MLPPHFTPTGTPCTPAANLISGETWRFSVITPSLIRCEWSAQGHFTDEPTRSVWTRDLGLVDFSVRRGSHELVVRTDRLELRYDYGPFRPGGLSIRVLGVDTHHALWRFDQEPAATLPDRWRNFGGTVRTLDDVDGRTNLGFGYTARVGYATVDDSGSLIIGEDNWVHPRADAEATDVYVVAYGHNFHGAVSDVDTLFGGTPLLPRWALGNWWSRYHAYTASDYGALLREFAEHEIPLSVAILDMDWHVTNPPAHYGTGWTGFTWDPHLFPNPAAFLHDVHEHGVKVGLNLHPADGIRPHEEPYDAVASHVGIEPGEAVPFNVADPAFWNAYFTHVLHPHEDAGVDFWWLDWQQGEFSSMDGLDPLWAINHCHYLDSTRPDATGTRQRGLTFSRYSGPGSGRYPIGFSGDTVISWESLAFQPEFTAAASNVAYGWWSHDIGGHLGGTVDPELSTRWTQLGVFSPILRLHSTKSDAVRREPWLAPTEHCAAQSAALRLRRQLVPYLYTLAERNTRTGIPPIEPLYWDNPTDDQVYTNPGQFWFGPSLLVAPATSARHAATGLTPTRAYLPPGRFVDMMTGTAYDGDRVLTLHRPLEHTAALLPAGTVLPLDADATSNGTEPPQGFDIVIAVGASGHFTLYEDDGGFDPTVAHTVFDYDDDAGTLTIHPVTGERSIVPQQRRYRVRLVGVPSDSGCICVDVGDVPADTGVRIILREHTATPLRLQAPGEWPALSPLLHRLPLPTASKAQLLRILATDSPARVVARAMELDIPAPALRPILEILTARS